MISDLCFYCGEPYSKHTTRYRAVGNNPGYAEKNYLCRVDGYDYYTFASHVEEIKPIPAPQIQDYNALKAENEALKAQACRALGCDFIQSGQHMICSRCSSVKGG